MVILTTILRSFIPPNDQHSLKTEPSNPNQRLQWLQLKHESLAFTVYQFSSDLSWYIWKSRKAKG